MTAAHLLVILGAALLASASPGPATLAIAGTAMAEGKPRALALASGVLTGSLTWSLAAALGLSTLMLAHAWLIEVVRWAGALYLLWLAWRSARSALRPGTAQILAIRQPSLRAAYLRGLLLHLTNPKAILFFASLYAVGMPAAATLQDFAIVVVAVWVQSAVVFLGYALLFSRPAIRAGFTRLRRPLDAAFAAVFGAAAFSLIGARLSH